MANKILTMSVSSPAQLSDCISKLSLSEKKKYSNISLVIEGEDILVCPFNFPQGTIKEIRQRIEIEAVELLSLPVSDIEYDFQILYSSKELASGIFVCMSNTILKQYLEVLDKTKWSALEITSCVVNSVNNFVAHVKDIQKRICLLDFSKDGIVQLAMFNDGRCDLIREISYEHFNDARGEVITTLRSACAQSSVKKFDKIFIIGDKDKLHDIYKDIQNSFVAAIEQLDPKDIHHRLVSNKFELNINLLRSYSLSVSDKNKFLLLANAGVLIAICFCGYAVLNVYKQYKVINDMALLYTASEYDYALKLQSQIKDGEK